MRSARYTIALIGVTLLAFFVSAAHAASGSDAAERAEAEAVHCANLVYGREKTSVCFAQQFLTEANRVTHIRVAPRFRRVRMDSRALFSTPLALMTGQGAFTLTPDQRENLRRYLTGGGFVVASAGCSSIPWNRSFRREIEKIFPDRKLKKLKMSHPIFHSVYDIDRLRTKKERREPAALEALTIDGRVALVYSPEGLNDTANAGGGCCCCGGNELLSANKININLLAYALTH